MRMERALMREQNTVSNQHEAAHKRAQMALCALHSAPSEMLLKPQTSEVADAGYFQLMVRVLTILELPTPLHPTTAVCLSSILRYSHELFF